MRKILFLFFLTLLLAGCSVGDAGNSKNIALVEKYIRAVEQMDYQGMAGYTWAQKQSGVDPFNPPRVQAQEIKGGPDGSAVRGAARGAAAGAAIGALTSAMAGRRSRVSRTRARKAQSQQTATNKENELINNFKKAFSACIEGKGYTVK